jgi:hypothetical protein
VRRRIAPLAEGVGNARGMFKTAHGALRILPDDQAVKGTSVAPTSEGKGRPSRSEARDRSEDSLRERTGLKLTAGEIDCDTPSARTGRGKMASEDSQTS